MVVEVNSHNVEIVGAPVACKNGIKETWREVADWAAGQLRARYGDRVKVEYFDLFDLNCPAIPSDCQLPVVFVDGKMVSSGGKISIPFIRLKLEELA
jgi:hypothetical protein